jgi:ABC-2 type transport system permease protein
MNEVAASRKRRKNMAQLLTMIGGECRRAIAVWYAYRVQAVSSLFIYALVFPLLMVLFEHLAIRYGVIYGPVQQQASLIGFLTWYLCMKVLAGIPRMVEEEAAVGTLENVWLTPAAPFTLLALRTITLCGRYLTEMALLAVVLHLFLRLPVLATGQSFWILLLTLLGSCGVGIGLAGAAIVYQSVGSLAGIVANLALIISGALTPLSNSGLVFTLLKYAFPTTWGIELLREAAAGQVVSPSEMGGLLMQTVLFLIIGGWLFHLSFSQAKMAGSLSAY